MTLASLFAALTAICAWICVPVFGCTFTLQTFAVSLTLFVLGGRWGTVSILVYLLLGAVGLPVFSGFQGGIGVLLGATGGYLWGFLSTGLCYWAVDRFGKLRAMVLGHLSCYLCGSLWFMIWSGSGLGPVLMLCVVPYLIPDTLKLCLAWYISKRIRKAGL